MPRTKRLGKCPRGSRKDPKRQNRCFTSSGVEMARPNFSLEDVVRHYFPNIMIKDDEYIVVCPSDEDSSTVFSIDDFIRITWLSKCGDVKGSDVLTRIIKIGKDLGKQIKLHDVSHIELDDCKYSLSAFYILLTGQSWYNKFKFKSVHHTENVKWNKKIRKMPLHKFMALAKQEYVKKELELFNHKKEELVVLDDVYKTMTKTQKQNHMRTTLTASEYGQSLVRQ
jgi:hypothetical protein